MVIYNFLQLSVSHLQYSLSTKIFHLSYSSQALSYLLAHDEMSKDYEQDDSSNK